MDFQQRRFLILSYPLSGLGFLPAVAGYFCVVFSLNLICNFQPEEVVSDCLATVHCVNARGDNMDRGYVIFNTSVLDDLEPPCLPIDWGHGHSATGHLNGHLFFCWFRCVGYYLNFLKKINESVFLPNS